jgi:hypothetical protein
VPAARQFLTIRLTTSVFIKEFCLLYLFPQRIKDAQLNTYKKAGGVEKVIHNRMVEGF